MKNSIKTPFRHDYVGSFLRPAELKKARADFAAGLIKADDLRAVEDHHIRELVSRQKAAGYQVLTDGEFRRATWHLDFFWGLNGIAHCKTEHGVTFHGEQALIDDTWLTGPISAGHHPFVDHFTFVKSFEDATTVAKQTIPAPAQLLQQLLVPAFRNATRKVYPDDEKLIEDIAAAYRTVIAELYAAGCRNLQLDDCTWGVLVSGGNPERYGEGADLKSLSEKFLRVNNLAIEGHPADLVVNTHVCRGNYHSAYFGQGAYDPIAPVLFAHENVDAFYLEFDDTRSGGFEPLRFVPDGKKVVLGLVTTKLAALEDPETVKARIRDAAKYVPLDRLCLSPQCGFASCEIGNRITDDDQWKKLALVKRIADEVWGESTR